MRWLVDECVDAALVDLLLRHGHDVLDIAEIASASTDQVIMERASGEDRLLLTEDKDFGELIFRLSRPVPGLILLRIDPKLRAIKSERLQSAILNFGEALYGRYTVVEPARFRFRSLHGT